MRPIHLISLLGAMVLTTSIVAACSGSDGSQLSPDSPDASDGGGITLDASRPGEVEDAAGDAVAPLHPADLCEAAFDAGLAPPDAAIATSRACYSGPASTRGVGRCKDGQLVCTSTGEAVCVGEVLPAPAETCNDDDDDCDGLVDEEFDTTTSRFHCGGCGVVCADDEACVSSTCQKRTETSCGNGIDDDGDGAADCADPECDALACGAGCLCAGGIRVETTCDDGSDNDGDGAIDCADPSCSGRSCGAGCTCSFSSKKTESLCGDGADNDDDGPIDCADPDCAGQTCGTGCTCTAGAKREADCGDGVDNDGDGTIDCADADCAGQTCGTGCTCTAGAKREGNCGDGVDNDGDGTIDCADADCVSASCGPGCICHTGRKIETICNDGIDNDGNNGADCADHVDCPQGTVCRRSNGLPGTCQANRTCG